MQKSVDRGLFSVVYYSSCGKIGQTREVTEKTDNFRRPREGFRPFRRQEEKFIKSVYKCLARKL